MANLLPVGTKRDLFRKTLVRMSIAGTILMVLVSGIGILALLPGYLTLHLQKDATLYDLARMGAGAGAQAQTDRDTVNATNKRIKIIAGLENKTTSLSSAIRTAVEERVSGQTLRRISYDSGISVGTSTPATLSLSGVFKDRNDQGEYLSRLKSNSVFSSVEIPLTGLVLTGDRTVTFLAHGNF